MATYLGCDGVNEACQMHYAITNQNRDGSHQPVEYLASVQFGVCPKIFKLTTILP